MLSTVSEIIGAILRVWRIFFIAAIVLAAVKINYGDIRLNSANKNRNFDGKRWNAFPSVRSVVIFGSGSTILVPHLFELFFYWYEH